MHQSFIEGSIKIFCLTSPKKNCVINYTYKKQMSYIKQGSNESASNSAILI